MSSSRSSTLIFLDIDGVLNSHADAQANGINTISRTKIAFLNQIVGETGAQLVISSAWRYMILGGAMTLDGFRYMLQTYGLRTDAVLHGHTVSDEEIAERGDQILAYLAALPELPAAWIVLDDASGTIAPSLIDRCGWRWLPIDGSKGLDNDAADAVVAMLQHQGARRTSPPHATELPDGRRPRLSE